VYGLASVDASGRVGDRTVVRALGWMCGTAVQITADAGRLVVVPAPGGACRVGAQGRPPTGTRRRGELHHRAALPVQARRGGYLTETDNPASKVAKPRWPASTRSAVPGTRLSEINQVAATTGNDPALDTLILRLHIETACRRGGALALRPVDLDPDQCLILMREKGNTIRWQPVSPTLVAHLQVTRFLGD